MTSLKLETTSPDEFCWQYNGKIKVSIVVFVENKYCVAKL